MEAIETYVSEPGIAPLETRVGLPSELSGVRAGHDPILEFAPKLGCLSDPAQPLLLARARNVESGEKTWLPAELVFNPAPPGAGASLYGASSNGLASGNSVLEASIHALYELIERDIWSLEFIRNHAAWVDYAELPRDVQTIAETADHNGLRLVIRYVPNDYGLPFFAAFLFEPNRFERRLFNGGWGCHPQREVALMRAVTEAAQSRLAFRSGLCEPEKSNLPGAEAERVSQQIEAISSRTPSIRFADIPQLPMATGLEAEWAAAVNCLRRVIDRPIYRVVYTPAEGPLHVVRLIVPLLEHFTPSTNRMGPRMRAKLEALARKSAQSSKEFSAA
jgi:ribosomal protein S12 methylthiotransferase accessory factor